MLDSYSSLQIQVSALSDYPIQVAISSNNLTFTDSIEVKAKNGYFFVPALYLRSFPGSKVQVKFFVNFFQSEGGFSRKEFSLTIDTVECLPGELVSERGFCRSCQGPDLYQTDSILHLFSDEIQQVLEDCRHCNKTVFTCNGGNSLTAQQGY